MIDKAVAETCRYLVFKRPSRCEVLSKVCSTLTSELQELLHLGESSLRPISMAVPSSHRAGFPFVLLRHCLSHAGAVAGRQQVHLELQPDNPHYGSWPRAARLLAVRDG
jgi:hypothetical protein